MTAITKTIEAVLGVAVLILAPLVMLAFWNHVTVGMVGLETGLPF